MPKSAYKKESGAKIKPKECSLNDRLRRTTLREFQDLARRNDKALQEVEAMKQKTELGQKEKAKKDKLLNDIRIVSCLDIPLDGIVLRDPDLLA